MFQGIEDAVIVDGGGDVVGLLLTTISATICWSRIDSDGRS